MPLNRDQQARPGQKNTVADYASNKYHQRTVGLDLVDADRPATPENGADKRPWSQTGRENIDSNGPILSDGKRFSLDSDLDHNMGTFKGFKVTVPNTLATAKHKTQQPAAPVQGRSQSKEHKSRAGRKMEKVCSTVQNRLPVNG